jgi:ribonuclease PH
VSAFEAHLLECGSAEGPELEQAKRSASGDPRLAIEEAASIAPRASHVRRDREKQRKQEGREQHKQRCCETHIEESLGDAASMSRSR